MSTRYALLGLPELAERLRQAGHDPLAQSSTAATARAVRDELGRPGSDLAAAVLLDEGQPFLQTWANTAASRLDTLVVLHGSHHEVTASAAIHIDLPATVHDVFSAIGFDTPEELTSVEITRDGLLADAAPADDWGDIPDDEDTPDVTSSDSSGRTVRDDSIAPDSSHSHASRESSAESDPQSVRHPEAAPASFGSSPETASEWVQPAGSTPAHNTMDPHPHSPTSVVSDNTGQAPAPRPVQETTPIAAEDMFGSGASDGTVSGAGFGLGDLVFGVAGKGGVGKTTAAILLAVHAASRGLRVTLIDGNRGQADVAGLLRLRKAELPTMHDAAVHSPDVALLTPDMVNTPRPSILPPVGFAVVLGPPPKLSDPKVVTAKAYRDMIDYARSRSDLVIVDTQILEATDTSGLIDEVVVPTLVAGAWAVGVSGYSGMSTTNMADRLPELLARGVAKEHLLTFLNAAPEQEKAAAELDKMPLFFSQFSTYLGSVPRIDSIEDKMNRGIIAEETIPDELADVFDEVLFRVRGLPKPDRAPAKKPSLFARMFGRGRA